MARLSASIFLLVSLAASAQEGPARYSGSPIKINAKCTVDDVSTLDLPCSAATPCPLYLELSSVAAVGNRLAVVGNLHTESTTIYSILLISDDDGVNWTEPTPRMLGAGFDQLQFVRDNGYVSGQILAPAPPHDPFFLVTTDGGASWRRQPVRYTNRPGVIDSFLFDGPETGMVQIDNVRKSEDGFRYEVFETANGGQTWSIHQFGNEKLPLRGREERAPNPYRLREDGATKAFVVERSRGEGKGWAGLARFAIAGGSCAPELVTNPSENPPERR